ncbi:hypothetical protein BLA29_002885 [Euroglyphus maynei]|uniref:Uncharacterized protein n=1 Tax=Euroglyphus maynei TaxID=6958 RepID=A0A1Y3BC07_EURMA|nr:hypothetical protein BLA29_002885 [Euroglyphus maynei]
MNAIDWFDDQSDEEVYGGDTDEEDNDVCESSDHDSESEQEAEEDEIDTKKQCGIQHAEKNRKPKSTIFL